MPKAKARKPSTSDSDSGPDDPTPAKKTKSETSSSKKDTSGDLDGWEIGRNRRVQLTEFKGKWYINIREYYMGDNGDLRPGKKGIMLTMEQWEKFRSIIPEVVEAVKRHV